MLLEMTDPRPIGMFDSGVGGLSVLKALRSLAPNERIVYFADTAWFPYGPRPAAEVRKRAFAITRRLLEDDVKMIVVACNTASGAAVADLRQAFDVPFVAMVPGLKPATLTSRAGSVVILATPGTLDGDLYARVVEEFARGTKVRNVAGSGLAELVEAGEQASPAAHEAVCDALGPAVRAGADTVVLGCTHYHFLAETILAEFPGIALVDTSEPVARRAVQVLEMEGLRAPPGREGEIDLIVSGDRAEFERKMERLGLARPVAEAAR